MSDTPSPAGVRIISPAADEFAASLDEIVDLILVEVGSRGVVIAAGWLGALAGRFGLVADQGVQQPVDVNRGVLSVVRSDQ